MSPKHKNILSEFLSLLNVKYSREFTNSLFNEHPYKNNMLGLSAMLSDYQVDNKGITVEDKEDALSNLEPPFIAHMNQGFVIVTNITPEKIFFRQGNKESSMPVGDFKKAWSGSFLIADPDVNSIEPGYKNNQKMYFIRQAQKYIYEFSILLLIILGIIYSGLYKDAGLSILFLINSLGIYVNYLLLRKQLGVNSDIGDKLCSMIKKSDCNNILTSSASRFMGAISWSEVGSGYFLSNLLIIIFFPHLISFMALINICALPYTIWSIWYQKFIAKQWCPLCIIVQALLWLVFITCILFGFISWPSFGFWSVTSVFLIYAIPYLTVTFLMNLLAKSGNTEKLKYELNNARLDEDLLYSQLAKSPSHKVDKTTAGILFGNPDARILVTILTNPHCNPCALMHDRVEKLLKKAGHRLCVQYVFKSFSKELDSSCKFLIATYMNNDMSKTMGIFSNWFRGGVNSKESFFKANHVDISKKEVSEEYERHSEWIDREGLASTPTILINGRALPKLYKIEDIEYFSFLDI